MTEIRCRISTPFSGASGSPAHQRDPDVGSINVASKRTVVVLPAPFGPRKPKTSPAARRNDTSDTASRSPNRLVNRSTTSTSVGPGCVGGTVRPSSELGVGVRQV